MYTEQTQEELDHIEATLSALLKRTEKAKALEEPCSAALWERIKLARDMIRSVDVAVWESMN